MTNQTVPTVRIKSTHPKSQGDFVEINEKDFDPKKHEMFDEADAPKVKATKVEKINATAEAIKFAEDAGFSLEGVKGTGKKGVITVEDVQDAIEAAEEASE